MARAGDIEGSGLALRVLCVCCFLLFVGEFELCEVKRVKERFNCEIE